MAFKKFNRNDNTADKYDDEYYAKPEQPADDFSYGNAEEAETPKEPQRPAQRRNTSVGAAYSMKLMKPMSYEDGPAIADELIKNNAVIINLEETGAETAANLIYFLAGITYAISGHIKQVSAKTYMLTPSNMEISDLGEAAPEEPAAEAQPQAPANGYGYQGYGSGYRG